MPEAFIVDAVRSPIGRRNGVLSSIRGDELAAQVLNGLVERNSLDPAEIEDVQLGCVTQIGEQGWNLGRMAPPTAGWRETVCGTTVDRQCGSSMQGNFNAAAAIWSGQLDVVVSAGVEMMSRVPMGSNGGDLSERLLERWEIVPQGISAEVIADEWGLSREEMDAYSLESHRRAVAAIDEGRFEREVVPVEVENPHAGVLVGVDETPRRDTSMEALAGLAWDDVAVIEVNEAFASVILQFLRDAGLEDRRADVNPNGGGISLGHPLGATGARVTATLLGELERRNERYGVASMCIGFGQAIAAVVERG